MKHLVSALAVLLLAVSTAPAATIEITRSSVNNGRAQNLLDARDAWMAGVVDRIGVSAFEDFELYEAGTHHAVLDTQVGQFLAGGKPSTGEGTGGKKVSILNSATSPFSGRFNYSDPGENWLDSNDITEVSLLFLDLPVNFLSFFITDANDVSGTLVLQFAAGGTTSVPITPGSGGNPSGVSYFVSYSGEALSALKWVNDSRNDGWGLDDMFIASKQSDDPVVPEPSTYVLIGAGLVGLTVWRRR